MAPILDGNSEIGALLWIEVGNLIFFKTYLFRSTAVANLKIYFNQNFLSFRRACCMFWVTILYKHYENSDKSFLMQSVRALQREKKIYLIFLVFKSKRLLIRTQIDMFTFIFLSFNFYVCFTYSMRPLRYVFSIKLLCFYYVVLCHGQHKGTDMKPLLLTMKFKAGLLPLKGIVQQTYVLF